MNIFKRIVNWFNRPFPVKKEVSMMMDQELIDETKALYHVMYVMETDNTLANTFRYTKLTWELERRKYILFEGATGIDIKK